MSGWLFIPGMLLVWAPALDGLAAWLMRGRRRLGSDAIDEVLFAGCVVMTAANALPPDWPWVAVWATLSAVFAFIWWRHRRKRRRALAALGAKGRARIAAMVSAMRERAKPRPVLKPQRSPA